MGSKLVVPRASPRLQRLAVTQARAKLGGLVSRVHRNKEYLILEQNGVPIAGVMDIDEFEDYLELRDPRVRTHIRQSSAEYLAGKSRPAEEFVAEGLDHMIEGDRDMTDPVVAHEREQRAQDPARRPDLAPRHLGLGRAEVGAKELVGAVDEVNLDQGSTLIATSRPSLGSRPRYTSPIPPEPIHPITS